MEDPNLVKRNQPQKYLKTEINKNKTTEIVERFKPIVVETPDAGKYYPNYDSISKYIIYIFIIL